MPSKSNLVLVVAEIITNDQRTVYAQLMAPHPISRRETDASNEEEQPGEYFDANYHSVSKICSFCRHRREHKLLVNKMRFEERDDKIWEIFVQISKDMPKTL